MSVTVVVRRPFALPGVLSRVARDEEHGRRAALGEDGRDARPQVEAAPAAAIDGPQHDQLIGAPLQLAHNRGSRILAQLDPHAHAHTRGRDAWRGFAERAVARRLQEPATLLAVPDEGLACEVPDVE